MLIPFPILNSLNDCLEFGVHYSLPWPRFNRIAARFIPTVRKTHPYPKERFYASPMVWQAFRFRV